jgi:hypothetical protein
MAVYFRDPRPSLSLAVSRKVMPHVLKRLYRDVVLEHSKRPRHRETLPDADRVGEVHNPLCGDRVKVMLRLSEDGRVASAHFTGDGVRDLHRVGLGDVRLPGRHLTLRGA